MNFLEKEEDKIERLKAAGKKDDDIVKILKQDREKIERIKAPYIELYGTDGPEINAFLNMFNNKSNTFKMDAMRKYVEEAGEPGDRIPLLEWMDSYLLESTEPVEVTEEEVVTKPVEKVVKEEEPSIVPTKIDKFAKNDADCVPKKVEECKVISAKAYIPKSKQCSPNAVNKTTEEKCKVIYAHSIKR